MDETLKKAKRSLSPGPAAERACGDSCCPSTGARPALVGHALRLELLTIGWNVVEGVVALWAAARAGSVVLLGFGVDSFVECASAAVLVWRLTAERRMHDAAQVEALDRQAHKLVGLSLYMLAAYVSLEAVRALAGGERPEPSAVGMALTSLSIAVMMWLARAKRRAAAALDSRALHADSFQTTACWWLSVITLCGVALNQAFGWWWADPVAAIGMCFLLAQEGRQAWAGEDCSC